MTLLSGIFNISHLIGHYFKKNAFGTGNFIHQAVGVRLYLVQIQTANKQKGL